MQQLFSYCTTEDMNRPYNLCSITAQKPFNLLFQLLFIWYRSRGMHLTLRSSLGLAHRYDEWNEGSKIEIKVKDRRASSRNRTECRTRLIYFREHRILSTFSVSHDAMLKSRGRSKPPPSYQAVHGRLQRFGVSSGERLLSLGAEGSPSLPLEIGFQFLELERAALSIVRRNRPGAT